MLQDNQRDLEQATEQLSEYLERDITSDMLVDIKQKVQDKFRLALAFLLRQTFNNARSMYIGLVSLSFALLQKSAQLFAVGSIKS